MANWKSGARVICPYYIREARYSITCEGALPGTWNMMRFETPELKEDHQRDFCEDFCYVGCPVAQLLEEKHKEEEEWGS